MHECLYCGKPIEVSKGEVSDKCCSDSCWEAYFAPGPKEVAVLDYDRIEEFA